MFKVGEGALYWHGNAAKTKIVADLINRANGKQAIVFDYGCGRGGDWPLILEQNPNLSLIGYEPYMPSFKLACERLAGRNAQIYSCKSLTSLNFKADFIVSFSVLEHVLDRKEFLLNAKRLMASNGLFYLNYDDGHFRNYIDLANTSNWAAECKVWLHNLFSRSLASIGFVSQFQERVQSSDLDKLLHDVGFANECTEYHNLLSFKEMFKHIKPELRSDFSRFWMDVETELNDRFCREMDLTTKGDKSNLWLQMASRTLLLRHIVPKDVN